MILIILILSWSILTAQISRDDKLISVITNGIYIASNQSNVINDLEYQLYTTNIVLLKTIEILKTERDISTIDLRLEKINSGKKFLLGVGVGGGVFAVLLGVAKYILK